MGDWFVISVIPTFLEKDIYNAIESYSLNSDGTVSTEFSFNKGDTLLDFLYVPGAKRKEISSAIKSFSKSFNPAKIKLGTKGKIIRTNDGKILGFYLNKSKSRSVLTYLSATGYETITVSTNKAHGIMEKNLEDSLRKIKKSNSTRISLLNAPHLKKKKN